MALTPSPPWRYNDVNFLKIVWKCTLIHRFSDEFRRWDNHQYRNSAVWCLQWPEGLLVLHALQLLV